MPGRFAALDLLRGVAAFAVLLWHAPTVDGRPLLGRAYLAVDLFFVLSGFVIAHAYELRLRSGGQFQRFCIARLIRLYPLYLACTLMSAGFVALAAAFGTGTHVSIAQLARSLLPALLFLPTPSNWSFQPAWLFPLAFTAWSLLWELLVNLAYGAGGYRLRGARIALPIGIGAFGIVAGLWIRGTVDLGWAWDTAWYGAPRALFSFFAGVAIFRARRRFRPPALPSVVLATTLLAALAVRGYGGSTYDGACVFLLFPLLVWLGAEAVQSDRVRTAATVAGYLSYPVYLLQAPFGSMTDAVAHHLAVTTAHDIPARVISYVAVTVLGSWVIARLYDSPVREWFGRRYLRGAPRPPAQTAP